MAGIAIPNGAQVAPQPSTDIAAGPPSEASTEDDNAASLNPIPVRMSDLYGIRSAVDFQKLKLREWNDLSDLVRGYPAFRAESMFVAREYLRKLVRGDENALAAQPYWTRVAWALTYAIIADSENKDTSETSIIVEAPILGQLSDYTKYKQESIASRIMRKGKDIFVTAA